MIDGTWAVARHELRLAWRDRAVLALGAVLTLLLVVATAVSTARHSTEAAQRARYQQLVGEQFQSQPDRHPHRVSHYGYLIFRPRAPLGAFDSGVERFAGTSVFLEAHRQNSANFSDASQGGAASASGS
jgi:ABC-2 type transport system permease protein